MFTDVRLTVCAILKMKTVSTADTMAHTCHPSTAEEEARASGVQGQPVLCDELEAFQATRLRLKNKNNK